MRSKLYCSAFCRSFFTGVANRDFKRKMISISAANTQIVYLTKRARQFAAIDHKQPGNKMKVHSCSYCVLLAFCNGSKQDRS